MLQKRDIQTRMKHEILRNYLSAWGGIIVAGLRRPQPGSDYDPARFLYFDSCSFMGRYAPDEGSAAAFEGGSAVLGVQGLDKLTEHATKLQKSIETMSVLVEQEIENYSELLQTLTLIGVGPRVRELQLIPEFENGQIAAIHGDWTTLTSQLLNLVTSATFAFAFLDPYGPKGVPFEDVSRVVSAPRIDSIIYWPFNDLQKKTGLLNKLDLSAAEEQFLQNYDRMFPDQRWRQVALEAPIEDAELRLVEHYEECLLEVDPTLTVKTIAMPFPDADRTMYYLFLTTHNPDGALEMNEVLAKANIEQETRRRYARVERQIQRTLTRPFWDLASMTPAPEQEEAVHDPTLIAEDLIARYANGSETLRGIKKALANTNLWPSDLNRALSLLKKDGRARWGDRLANDTLIRFYPKVKTDGR